MVDKKSFVNIYRIRDGKQYKKMAYKSLGDAVFALAGLPYDEDCPHCGKEYGSAEKIKENNSIPPEWEWSISWFSGYGEEPESILEIKTALRALHLSLTAKTYCWETKQWFKPDYIMNCSNDIEEGLAFTGCLDTSNIQSKNFFDDIS